MDRNTLTGLVLIFVIIGASVFLMKPSDEEIKKEQQLQDSLALVRKGLQTTSGSDSATIALPAAIDSATLTGPFGQAVVGQEQIVTIENDLIKAHISTKGGRVKDVEVDGEPLTLLGDEHTKFGLSFPSAGKDITTNDLFFTPNGGDVHVTGQDSASVTLRLSYAENQYIDYIYSIKGGDHNLGLTIVTKGLQNVVSPNEKRLVLHMESPLLQQEKDLKNERQRSTSYYRLANGDVERLSPTKDDEKEINEKLQWVSFKQHFFSSVLVSENSFEGGKINVYTTPEDGIVKLISSNLYLDFARTDVNTYPMHFYFGPNQYRVLKEHGYALEEQIDMGWGPMKWINRFITIPAFSFLDGIHLGYGVVKLILSPLTYRSYVSMAKMRVLKPEMDEIKEKVGQDNPTLLQQEYLKLYKQAGVNPLGGCIPMVLQMPFTIAFFFFFPNLFELRGEHFMWVNDLSTYDSAISVPPIFGVDHISLMCILMTITTLTSTWYNNSVSGATGQMKYIGYFMPLIFLFVLNSYPAGLNYYYFLSTVFTVGTQIVIRQMINDEKIHAIIQANKQKPQAQKKSKFQQRMEDYMRQQQTQGKGKGNK